MPASQPDAATLEHFLAPARAAVAPADWDAGLAAGRALTQQQAITLLTQPPATQAGSSPRADLPSAAARRAGRGLTGSEPPASVGGVELSVYEAAGGAAGLLRLAAAWHHRCRQDPVVSHAFSHADLHPQHTERLAAYWGEALGGPASYTAALGDHSHVLRLHAGNGEHGDMDRRAQQCFALAMDDAGLSGDPRLRRTLADWFGWMTAAMAAYPRSPDDVPRDLPLPVWSWHGLVDAP